MDSWHGKFVFSIARIMHVLGARCAVSEVCAVRAGVCVQQSERDRALAAFTRGDAPLMFATDVAARGLDIKGVTHVMNFDMAR
eukprot:scaffold344938_cov48-Prasinocladus_malaysianus.AAC.1